jgi:hypothetical protein
MSDINKTYVFETVSISGLTFDNNDYTVSGSLSGNTAIFTRLSGGTFAVDFSTLATEDNNDFVTGGTFNTINGNINFIRTSGDTFTINLDGRYLTESAFNTYTGYTETFVNTDDYVTGMTFNTNNGVLSLSTLSGDTITEDLDGRYLLIDNYTPNEFNTDDYTNSVILSGTTLIFSRISGATYNVDLAGFSGSTQTDDYTTGVTFNTGILEFSRLSGGTYSVNLDGRYVLQSDFNAYTGTTIGPFIFDIDTSGTTSYIGYGDSNACKIRRIETISGSTYEALWSNGEEILDKVWSNRLTYLYF